MKKLLLILAVIAALAVAVALVLTFQEPEKIAAAQTVQEPTPAPAVEKPVQAPQAVREEPDYMLNYEKKKAEWEAMSREEKLAMLNKKQEETIRKMEKNWAEMTDDQKISRYEISLRQALNAAKRNDLYRKTYDNLLKQREEQAKKRSQPAAVNLKPAASNPKPAPTAQ